MQYKYGEFTETQMSSAKESIRKSIFFLLLCVDPKTREQYSHIDVERAFDSLFSKIDGFNSILLCPPELVLIVSLLESARMEYEKTDEEFSFIKYRKLILDAGTEVLKIKETDNA